MLKINKTVKWAYSVLINESIKLADYDEVAQAWVNLYNFDPELAKNYVNVNVRDATCNKLRLNYPIEYAEHVIDFALEKDPGTAWAYKQLSHIYNQKGELYAALSLAEKGFFCDGQDRWVAQNYILLLMKAGDMKKADALLSKCLQENENSLWGNLCRAIYYHNLNDYANALNYSEKALSIDPNDRMTIDWNQRIKDSAG